MILTASALLQLSAPAETFTEGKQVPPSTEKLKAGDFVWEPERAPAGPVLIVVSKPEQVAYVYRNGCNKVGVRQKALSSDAALV